MLSQDTFPEDMAVMEAMEAVEAMEAMEAMAVDMVMARGRPKLDMAVMAVATVVMEDMEAMAVDTDMARGLLMLRLDTPEDMEAMVVMEAMEAMEATAVDTVMARGRPKLDMAVMAVAMVVMVIALEAMEEDIMVNCYHSFSSSTSHYYYKLATRHKR
jgi:hypothetical protein